MTTPTLKLIKNAPFGYAARLSALPSPMTYAGKKVRVDVRDGQTLVHDFGEVAITPQTNGTGLLYLNAPTNTWPVEKLLTGNVLVVDENGGVLTGSNNFNLYIENTPTDTVTQP